MKWIKISKKVYFKWNFIIEELRKLKYYPS